MLFLLSPSFFLLFDIGMPSLAVEFKTQGEPSLLGRDKGCKKKVRAVGQVCLMYWGERLAGGKQVSSNESVEDEDCC